MCNTDETKRLNDCEAAGHDCSACASSDGNGGCGHSHTHGEQKEQTVEEFLDMTYKNNQVIVARLDKIIDNLKKTDRNEIAAAVTTAVSEFEKGNMYLSLALSMLRQE